MEVAYYLIREMRELAEKSSLKLSLEQKIFLDEMTSCNINARYPDFKTQGVQNVDSQKDKEIVYQVINRYIDNLKKNNIPLWRIYLYGSYAKNSYHSDSDIDLAIFWDKDDIDGFDEDLQLMRLRWDVDLRIEPHSFAKTDFDETNPFVKEIIKTGERIV